MKNMQWRAEEAIAGNAKALEKLREYIIGPLCCPREDEIIGVKWPRGLLLHGPPGTGKTSLVRAVVQECGANLTILSPRSVHKANAGESERVLREAFSEASSHHAMSGKPSVILIDEIDALCPRDSRREQDFRVNSQLCSLMDSNKASSTSPPVVVVASTNRVDAIDLKLRRYGRFDVEIVLTMPTEEERFQILKLYTKTVPLDPNLTLRTIATSCNGYVGADLEDLCREAIKFADKSSDAAVLSLTMEHFQHAKSLVGPSTTRGATVEIQKVTWDDIKGLKDLKKKLQKAVESPIIHSAAYSRMNVRSKRGILLHGPPGCSKTTLAKAIKHVTQASFFSLSCAEVFSKYVGEGEALLRNTFRTACLAAPSIIFFDEVDTIAAKRDGSSSGNGTVGERLTTTLLTEMDGLEEAKGVLVLAATNRPHAIDPALMRSGRFDLVLYVPPPDQEARYEILCLHTCNMKIGNDVDLRKIAEDTELFTGADLKGLCMEVGILASRENKSVPVACDRHFQTVKNSLKPSLTRAELDSYSSFKKTSTLSTSAQFESSILQDKQHKKEFLGPLSLVKIGVVIFVLLAVAAKYFLMCMEKHIQIG